MLSTFILGGRLVRSGATISFLGFFCFSGRLSCSRFFFFNFNFSFRVWKNVLPAGVLQVKEEVGTGLVVVQGGAYEDRKLHWIRR